MQHRNAVLTLFLTALLWSLGGLLIKSIPWTPLAVAGGRSFFAAAFLLLMVRPRRLTLTPLTLATAVCHAGCTVCLVVATKLTTAANAILLQYTSPVWVALFGAWILREKPGRADWIAIAATLGGVSLFFAGQLSAGHLWGNAVGLASGVFFGFVAILLRKQKDAAPVDSIILGTLLAGIVCAPALAAAPALDTRGWLALALLGTVQLGLSYFLYAWAIRHVSALEAVLIPVLEPILNPVWVMLALGEKPGPWAMLGGAMVLGASVSRAWVALAKPPARMTAP
ncbi:MAG: DMT family transporter [Burkholderiaceae bacterium]|jgi:drug/metabolite transporter (DMT)-like permease|nr:DMT family transporter [Burkholderiaceae bacterium]